MKLKLYKLTTFTHFMCQIHEILKHKEIFQKRKQYQLTINFFVTDEEVSKEEIEQMEDIINRIKREQTMEKSNSPVRYHFLIYLSSFFHVVYSVNKKSLTKIGA